MKYKIAWHDDHKIPGYLAKTLIVTGTVDKYGKFKKGIIHAQTFGGSIDDAEKFAEKLLYLLNNNQDILEQK